MANFTKQAIKAAFLELLDEKPLNKISVRDIVERCGINRNSFYYHFQDIPSLLGEIIIERTNDLMAQYPIHQVPALWPLYRLDARRHEAGCGRADGARAGTLPGRSGADSGKQPRVRQEGLTPAQFSDK